MKTRNIILSAILLLIIVSQTKALDLEIEGLRYEKIRANRYHVTFTVSWNNAWNQAAWLENHDAVWVFVKYKDNNRLWQHALIEKAVETGALLKADIPEDRAGCYLVLKGTGHTDVDEQRVTLLIETKAEINDFRVLGLEMVYVPEGDFWLGDGQSSGSFRKADSEEPVRISEEAIVVRSGFNKNDDHQLMDSGILVDGDEGLGPTRTEEVVNTDFPTGYKAFYMMKYELTQGQYTDFLNLLDNDQAARRYSMHAGDQGNTVSHQAGTYVCSTPRRGMNWISWMDLAAYADWAGLRPLTELEYEKACRGPKEPLSGEYAWGGSQAYDKMYVIAEGQLEHLPETGNMVYNKTDSARNHPVAIGLFERTGPKAGRKQLGAGYYGAMELSGNLFERFVSLGNHHGRHFCGNPGDGSLSPDGHADEESWPGYSGGQVISASGSGWRGGSWNYGQGECPVSERNSAAYSFWNRSFSSGIRLGRSVR